MDANRSDVLVVGAGPVGLALAVRLVTNELSVTVVDQQSAGTNTSRAAVVHARTLESLEPLGVTERMIACGLKAPRFTVRDRDRILLPADFSGLRTSYPYALMLSQAETEKILLARLLDLGGRIVRPAQLTAFSQNPEGVTAVLHNGEELHARFLAGADGMHSTVRQHAGIPFDGDSYKASFLLADVRMTGAVPHNEVILYFSPAGMVVVAPLPGGTYRVVATVKEAPETPDVQYVQELLDRRGPEKERAAVHEVVWGSRFHVHHRVARHYQSGRVFLAGDAAHVHSPAGGQGMNIGIQDAVVLGQLLAETLRGGAFDRLAQYERSRRPVALNVVALTDRLTRLATAPPVVRAARNALLAALGHVPQVRQRIALRLAGFGTHRCTQCSTADIVG